MAEASPCDSPTRNRIPPRLDHVSFGSLSLSLSLSLSHQSPQLFSNCQPFAVQTHTHILPHSYTVNRIKFIPFYYCYHFNYFHSHLLASSLPPSFSAAKVSAKWVTNRPQRKAIRLKTVSCPHITCLISQHTHSFGRSFLLSALSLSTEGTFPCSLSFSFFHCPKALLPGSLHSCLHSHSLGSVLCVFVCSLLQSSPCHFSCACLAFLSISFSWEVATTAVMTTTMMTAATSAAASATTTTT